MKPKLALCLLAIVLALVVVAPSTASALDDYDVELISQTWNINDPVTVNIRGPANMSVTVIVRTSSGEIMAGSTALKLDKNGTVSWNWVPQQVNDYKATVNFASGISITRSFRVFDRIQQSDLDRLLSTVEFRLAGIEAQIDQLKSLGNTAIAFSV